MTKEQLKNYRHFKDLLKHIDRGVYGTDPGAREWCARQVAAVEKAIESVPDPAEQLLLRLRYMEGQSWVKIGFALHYGESQVKRIHRRALRRLEEVKGE